MIKLTSGDPAKLKFQTWMIPVCEDADIHGNPFTGLVEKARMQADIKGESGEQTVLYGMEGIAARRVIFCGMGKAEKINPESFRKIAGKAVSFCLKHELSDLLLIAPDPGMVKMESGPVLRGLMEGAFLANYIFDQFKGEKKKHPVKQLGVFTDAETAAANRQLPAQTVVVCEGTLLARSWVSMPSNEKRPGQFSDMIRKAAEKQKLKVTVLDEKALKQNQFGGILAVGQGSDSPPRLLVLEYRVPKAKKTIVLVGKGVTFDSGGISLKPAAGMDEMKTDMAGAAATAGALIATAGIRPKFNVIGIIPLVENMPSGTATRPGDIITTYSGKTVEIGNTDAEGRLILIDALAYAIKTFKPEILIDMATLTGACVVALGEKIAGVFSPDTELAEAVVAAGEEAHERCWRMPMPDDYKELLKSDFADISNMSSTRYGGAITAALFLSEFVEKTRWVHIDIAGPSAIKKAESYCPPGGTGFGVRLFCNLLDRL